MGSSVVQRIGVLGTTLPAASNAWAVNANGAPVFTDRERGEILTDFAFAPAPVYTTGMDTGAGAACPGTVGTAMICAEPEKTVSPPAFLYARSSWSGSPVAGAPTESRMSRLIVTASTFAGKLIVVSMATVPSARRSTTRTRSNAMRSATPESLDISGKIALKRTPVANRGVSCLGAVGSPTQLSRTTSTTKSALPMRAKRRSTAGIVAFEAFACEVRISVVRPRYANWATASMASFSCQGGPLSCWRRDRPGSFLATRYAVPRHRHRAQPGVNIGRKEVILSCLRIRKCCARATHPPATVPPPPRQARTTGTKNGASGGGAVWIQASDDAESHR